MTTERQKSDPVDRNYEIVINIPEKVIGRLPEDFRLEDIGTIDLAEADAIANEKILFLTETDLIEGLEDFDLIPLKKDEKPVHHRQPEPQVTFTVSPPEKKHSIDSITDEELPSPERFAKTVENTPGDSGDDDESGVRWVPLETMEMGGPPQSRHDDMREWVPLESITPDHAAGIEETASGSLTQIPESREIIDEMSPADSIEFEPVMEAGPRAVEGDSISDESRLVIIDEYPIVEEPVFRDASREIPAASMSEAAPISRDESPPEPSPMDAPAVPDVQAIDVVRHIEIRDHETGSVPAPEIAGNDYHEMGGPDSPEGDDAIWLSFDGDSEGKGRGDNIGITSSMKPLSDNGPLVAAVESATSGDVPVVFAGEHRVGVVDDRPGAADGTGVDDVHSIVREFLPEALMAVGLNDQRVHFIDDHVLEKEAAPSGGIFDASDLDRITAEMVVIDEGRGFNVREAGPGEDRDRVVAVSSIFTQQNKDLVLEIDDYYKYHDEDVDFIHSAIVEEDYSRYIRGIDDLSVSKKKETVSEAREILGLGGDEFTLMESVLFGEDYQNVNLYEIFDFFAHETDRTGRAIRIEKNCTYLLPEPESLQARERQSIEEDVTSSNALIYEEDAEEIRRLLVIKLGPSAPAPVPVFEVVDTVYDITDRVVILEDVEDVDRFVKSFPEEKQVDIKNLLKYLDGLFERLPENIIKKFASSDYFNLYLKVLNELDV